MHFLRDLGGAIGPSGPVVAPSSTSASGTAPSTGTASGIMAPSTCVSVITKHMKSVSGGYDYYSGQTASVQSMYLPPQWILAA
jgi:hypothetical protein